MCCKDRVEIVAHKRKYIEKLCDKPTIPRAKWNIIGCLSSNERMLVASSTQFGSVCVGIDSRACVYILHSSWKNNPVDCVWLEESFLPNDHLWKVARYQIHQTDRFQLFTIYRAIWFAALQLLLAAANESTSISLVDSVECWFCTTVIGHERSIVFFLQFANKQLWTRVRTTEKKRDCTLHYAPFFLLEAPQQITKCASTFARSMYSLFIPLSFAFIYPAPGAISDNRYFLLIATKCNN